MGQSTNSHIRVYLDNFLAKPSSFAVMLAGDWGTGKTFLIRDYFRGRSDVLYISVNGTSAPSQIVERLYLAAFPVFKDKTVQAFGSIARSIAGAFRIKSDLKMEDLLDIDKYNILVFDDLERSIMPIGQLLGFINDFVEHDDKHVIIASNEKDLETNQDYLKMREKVIGFSLDVLPNYDSFINEFCKYDGEYNSFVEKCKETIVHILREGGLKNLRVLKYVLQEFEDIFHQCKYADLSHDELKSILLTFTLLDYYYTRLSP